MPVGRVCVFGVPVYVIGGPSVRFLGPCARVLESLCTCLGLMCTCSLCMRLGVPVHVFWSPYVCDWGSECTCLGVYALVLCVYESVYVIGGSICTV